MADLKIVSLNVRGLRSRDKRLKIFEWIKMKHKADIVCLQETHSTLLDEKLWADEWGGEIHFSHGDANARGVCIMTRLSSTLNDIKTDTNGRYVMIDVTLSEKSISILNLYAPNHDDPNFIIECINVLEEHTNADKIMVGDFNCVISNSLDKKGGNIHSNRNMQTTLASYLEDHDMIDIWRQHHPDKKSYTFHAKHRNEHIFYKIRLFSCIIWLE